MGGKLRLSIVRIPYRKKKLLNQKGEDNITFYVLNNQCNEVWEIRGATLSSSDVVEVSNKFVKEGELFFSVPVLKVKKILLDKKGNM